MLSMIFDHLCNFIPGRNWVKNPACFLYQAKCWLWQPTSTYLCQPQYGFLWRLLSPKSQQARCWSQPNVLSKVSSWYFGFGFSQVEILYIPRKILPAFKGVGVGARRHGKRRRRPMVAPLTSPGASPHRLGGRSSINLQRRRALRPVPAKGRPHKHQPRSAMKLVHKLIFSTSFLASIF